MDDIYVISSSQEELLQRTRFIGESQLDNNDDASQLHGELPVASDGILMVSPPDTQDGGIDSSGNQDVFHTPPEGSSLLISSDEQQPNVASDGDRCVVNQAVNVDCGTEVFVDFCEYSDRAEVVDLGRDSDLGFSEPQLTQVIDHDSVTECSRGVEGDSIGDDSACQFDEFGVLERGLCELGELPVEKLKLSEQKLGFDYSEDCFGVELQKVGEGTANCKGKLPSEDSSRNQPKEICLDGGNCYREISIDKKLGSGENFETEVVQVDSIETDGVVHFCEAETLSPGNFGDDLQPQENVQDVDNCCREIAEDINMGSGGKFEAKVVKTRSTRETADVIKLCEDEKLACTVKGNKSSDKVIEGSERKKRIDEEPELRVLPPSLRGCLDNKEKGMESGKGGKKNMKQKCSPFDVLRALTKNTNEVQDSSDSVCWLKVAKLRGLTFPTPRWWPNDGNFKKQRQV